MRKLQVESAIFGYEPGADAIGKADVADDPVRSGERFGGQRRRIPKKVGALVPNFVWGELKNFSFVDLNQQKAIVHLKQQRVAFFLFSW